MASVLKNRHFIEGLNTSQTEVFNWEDVAARARQYLETVRLQATQVMQEAREEASRLKQEAVSTGLQSGQDQVEQMANKRASQIAQEQISSALKTVEALNKQLEEATQQWLRQWQHETIPLAIAIAEKLISRQIDSDPEILMAWIANSVHTIQTARKIQLRMNPMDALKMKTSLDHLLLELQRTVSIELIEDDKIQPRGIVLETAEGRIDMQLSTQLARLAEELK